MKLSIITVSLNSKKTIISTLNSILSQSYMDLEHIIVDGGSTDGTIEILKEYNHINKKIILKKNCGIYESMNIGIKESSGDIITILNSDDIYQNKDSISDVIEIIKKNQNYSIFLGDVVYFKNSNFYNIYRYYNSKNFKRWHLKFGLMPPHPSSFIKKEIYNKYGLYYPNFEIASDFEIFLRFFFINKIDFYKINKVIVRMRMGGISGKNLRSYLTSTIEILKSFKLNKLNTNLFSILLRLPPKIFQYFFIPKKKLNIDFKLFKLDFGIKYLDEAFKIIKEVKHIPFDKNFILSGLNLAYLGYYFKGNIENKKNLYHWPDGLFAKSVFDNIKKIPGRELISKCEIPFFIKKIIILGNLSDFNKEYLIKKFKLPIVHKQLPYGSINELKKHINITFDNKSLIFLTLPTPKQEQVALELAKKNKYYKIICIGASISIASGEEKAVPSYMENYEFIWRLRTDPFRRIIRLLESMYFFLKGNYIQKKLKNINLYSID